jgi:hypothetical protein
MVVANALKEGQCKEGILELEVEYDGGMIPVATLESIETPVGEKPERTKVRGLLKRHKNCRWEEAKLGLVQIPGEVEGRLYTVRPTAELDLAFNDLFALACIKGWSENTQVRGLADGARHIRPCMAEAFHASPFIFILDRPHAKEHLAKAGYEFQNLGIAKKEDWISSALTKMENGHASDVVAELRLTSETYANETLSHEADYFERNQDAVAVWSKCASKSQEHGGIQTTSKISLPCA